MLFLLLLFFLPLSVVFKIADKEAKIGVKAFGLKVGTFDTAKPRRKGHEEKEQSREEKESEKKSLSEQLDTFQMILKVVSRVLHHVRLLPRIKKLRFHLAFGLSDAAKTGMAAGGIYALVYGIQARLHHSRRVSIEEVSVVPDFQSQVFSVHCSGIITTCLAHIMGIAVVALAVILKQKLKEE